MATPEAPHWDETETKQRMSMYNERTRCIDSVVFLDQNTAIGYFVLRPELLPPLVKQNYPTMTIGSFGSRPFSEEIEVSEDVVEGHFTPEFGISVVRGIDQLAAALQTHTDNINTIATNKDARLRRIASIKFPQPVVVGDKMIIVPSNFSEDFLTGDSTITVDGSTVTSIVGIEFEMVEAGDYPKHHQAEFAKPLLIEFGAQTAVADFLYRRDFQTVEKRDKGDFLVYAGIKGPVEWYEEVYPNQLIEAHSIKDPANPLQADVSFWTEGRKVAQALGNECGIGNRERTKQLIERVVRRRRARVKSTLSAQKP